MNWPEGKDFAFTIVDDTDHATIERIKPIYDLLHKLKLKTTKTVWTFPHENSQYKDTQTLEDEEYLGFIKRLIDNGFEIASHGAKGNSSKRETTIKAFESFYEKLGFYPRMHVNHAQNKENLYWSFNRLFNIQKLLHNTGIKKYSKRGIGYGAVENSDYFWGDLSLKHIDYVRSGNFRNINTLNVDRDMPYNEKRFPYVNAWFSGSDGSDYRSFIDLLSESNQTKLIKENGLCIVNTHLGVDGFLNQNGEPTNELVDVLSSMSTKNGWFVPASEILDYLKVKKGLSQVNSFRHWYKTRNK
jgi:hypothetical protein